MLNLINSQYFGAFETKLPRKLTRWLAKNIYIDDIDLAVANGNKTLKMADS
jgi:hypothetical protein